MSKFFINRPIVAMVISILMTIIGLVAAGLGVSVLPASFQHMRIKGVVYRPLLDADAHTAVWLVQRKDQKSPMARAFVELLTRKVEPLKS